MGSYKENLAKKLKLKLLKKASSTKSRHVHIGSCLSCFDIIFQILINEKKKEDSFILSKGHAALAWYTILNYQKKISNKTYERYLSESGELGIHPSSLFPKDIPLATGSLGHGLSFACGLAKANLLKRKKTKVYCLISDGECNEGSIWEAALFASSQKLNNLIVLLDKNNFQAFGRPVEVMGEAATAEKWQAFGFNVYKCNGHDLKALHKAFIKVKKNKSNNPNIIICDTKRGKGIKEIEDKLESNYLPITSEILNRYEKKIS